MRDIKAMLPEEIAAALAEMGQPKYRAKQIFQWLARGASSFDEMTNLSKDLRAALAEQFYISRLEMLRKQVSAMDGTIKYLWQLDDGNAVETVVMHYKHGNTICISSQVGCRQGCAFCASTIGGLIRSLEPSEMLDEVLYSERESGCKISNIVLMGIGEPLDNFDNVMRFLELVNHPDGENIGMRHISLSTCGLIERFDDLAARDLQLTLSVSLHAPDDETRSKIMPANRGRGVQALIDACARYYQATGRRRERHARARAAAGKARAARLRACEPHPAQPCGGACVPAVHTGAPQGIHTHFGAGRRERDRAPQARQRCGRVLRPAAQEGRGSPRLKGESPCNALQSRTGVLSARRIRTVLPVRASGARVALSASSATVWAVLPAGNLRASLPRRPFWRSFAGR